jgi:hypothetical protein
VTTTKGIAYANGDTRGRKRETKAMFEAVRPNHTSRKLSEQ